ncbi:glycan-binding surface protein [Bacteroidota bacterium]
MKKFKISKIISQTALLIIFGSIIFISCKEDEKPGPPTINKVRLIDPETADSAITQADPGTLVVIEGENFDGLLNVYFNNYNSTFNRVFITNTNIIVRIPAETPTAIIDPTVSNELKVVTETGEATHTFVLSFPPPEILLITNENALPGDTIYFLGNNLYFIEKIIFPGNIEATDYTVFERQGIILITVPDGVSEGGPVTIETTYDIVESSMKFNDISGDDVICNFDDINSYIWGCQISSDNNAFPGARGSFAHLTTTNVPVGNYEWWGNNRVCFLDSINIIPEENMGDIISEYQLKFEMYVNEPWNTGSLSIILSNWDYRFLMRPWIVDGKRTDFVTNGWITITVPLNEFLGSEGDGDPAESLDDLFWENGFGRIGFPFMNDGADPDNPETEGIVLETLSIALDNIRLVNISNLSTLK